MGTVDHADVGFRELQTSGQELEVRGALCQFTSLQPFGDRDERLVQGS